MQTPVSGQAFLKSQRLKRVSGLMKSRGSKSQRTNQRTERDAKRRRKGQSRDTMSEGLFDFLDRVVEYLETTTGTISEKLCDEVLPLFQEMAEQWLEEDSVLIGKTS